MKHKYLVSFDYGMSGEWGYVLADSADDILSAFPEVKVHETPPEWLSEEILATFGEPEEVNNVRLPGVLGVVTIERLRPGYQGPSKPENPG